MTRAESIIASRLLDVAELRILRRTPMKKVPEVLDRITDRILAYKPKPKTKAAKRRARKKKRDAAKS